MEELEIVFGGDTTKLYEQPDSPFWQWTDKVVVTRKFVGTPALCKSMRPLNGAFGTGEYLGLRVTEASIAPQRGGLATLTFKMEGLAPSEPLPPDDGGVEMSQQEYALEKHPRYSGLDDDLKQSVRHYANATNPDDRTKYYGKISGTPLALELAQKLITGQTHFWLFVPVYKWVTHSYTAPRGDEGGYPQAPFGPFPYPDIWDWLRQGDTLIHTGQYWQLTRSWIASDYWDDQIYPVL